MAARKPKGRWASRIVGEADVAPDQLLANPNNFRMHPAQQQNALADVLDKVGWVQRVVVNRRTGHVIDGHLRVEMAISQGEPSVPVVYVDLSLEEEKVALATFDPISAMATVDEAMLAALLNEITAESPDLVSLVEAVAEAASVDLGDVEPESPAQSETKRYTVSVTVDSVHARDELVDLLNAEGYEPEVR